MQAQMNRFIVAIALQSLALSGMAQAPEPPSAEQQLLKLLNLERQKLGVPALQWDAKVAEAAQGHSQRLASHRALSHQFAGEPELTYRLGATGARFSAVAENIAVADDPEEAHLALMNSPGHRANILNPEYNAVGIATAKVDKQLYVTEDFAHVVPAYSDAEFREGVVAAFNRLRRAHHMGPIDSHSDSRLDREACTRTMDSQWVLQDMNYATRATIFTAVEPNDLPSTMDRAASDIGLHRMNIGVCFRKDPSNQLSRFWVIAAFYQTR